jgi:hypothetical protein
MFTLKILAGLMALAPPGLSTGNPFVRPEKPILPPRPATSLSRKRASSAQGRQQAIACGRAAGTPRGERRVGGLEASLARYARGGMLAVVGGRIAARHHAKIFRTKSCARMCAQFRLCEAMFCDARNCMNYRNEPKRSWE